MTTQITEKKTKKIFFECPSEPDYASLLTTTIVMVANITVFLLILKYC